ncbi:uncharacterized protein [Phaenicophaeus curvirostris]|uniref:uncharacterized protein isoform X2 n=1 Tax=Phaenicophaeus curvirostris TaxID=33595 RepID=UPI0037F0999C
MGPRGVGMGWLCIVVLCSGAALVLQEEEPGHQNITQHDNTPDPTGDSTTTTEDVDRLTTWPTASPSSPWSTDPVSTALVTQAGATGNKTHHASAVPIRYWSPVIFVLVALLVLFFTYRRTKGEDLGDLDHLPIQDTAPIIPRPQEERKGSEKPSATDHTETTFSEPDPPPQLLLPQPDPPAATAAPGCSEKPGAD